MGGSSYSSNDHAARKTFRATTSTPTFIHTAAVKSGKVAAAVHATLEPKGAVRESRDSDTHPESIPMLVIMDTTGSMGEVPGIFEDKLSHLMGVFLEDKASGKKYLGNGYPAILIGAVDDYDAMHGNGALQMGQFESGIEIDNNLENLWLTGNGGGTYHESYELAFYFAARKTVTDHWEKRGRKGYMFLSGDEHAYDSVRKIQVKDIIGDDIEADIPLKDIIAEVKERYHVFFIIPNMTSYYSDKSLRKYWSDLLGQQNMLLLEDPTKICELIAGTVAITEEFVGIDELVSDGVIGSAVHDALVPYAKSIGSDVAKHSASGLSALPGSSSGNERL